MAPNWPETMAYNGYISGEGFSLTPTVAGRAVQLWHGLSRERIPVLLKLNAPAAILWNEMYRFKPGRVPVASLPQYELLEGWKNEPILKEEKNGRMYHFSTPKGVIAFDPKGRWGPYFKEMG